MVDRRQLWLYCLVWSLMSIVGMVYVFSHSRDFRHWIPLIAGAGFWTWGLAFFIERYQRRTLHFFTGILTVLALVGILLETGRPLYRSLRGDDIRAWNVFHYYLGSKYFPELGYLDLYAATLAADDAWKDAQKANTRPPGSAPDVKSGFGFITEARDMHDYFQHPRSDIVQNFDLSKISDARLEQLGADSRFLRPYLGKSTWSSVFHDLGYNPAPPWTIVGTTLSNLIPARFPYFWIIANSDLPLYMLSILLAIWAFGLRITAAGTLWLTTIHFNDGRFAGGFLQYDWLATSIIALALLVRGYSGSSGVVLSWAAMTRVFPGFLIFPMVVSILADLWHILRLERQSRESRTSIRMIWRQIPLLRRRFVGAFIAACTLLFIGSHFTGRGLQTWPEWVEKMSAHAHKHAITSNQRIGVGRLSIHHPTAQKFFAEWPGDGAARLEQSSNLKRILQLLGLLVLVPALIRRSDPDRMILALLLVLLGVTLSRYYGAIFVLLFALNATTVSDQRLGLSKTDASLEPSSSRFRFIAGAVLLGMAAFFDIWPSVTARYFMANYLLYGLFLTLCVGYAVKDWAEKRTGVTVTGLAPSDRWE